jgi:hypothetical protein
VCRRFGQVLRDHHQFLWFLCFELRYAMDLTCALSLARRADLIQRQREIARLQKRQIWRIFVSSSVSPRL